MQRSVVKIIDENVLLFSSQTKFAEIMPFNADNHVISGRNVAILACGRKKFSHSNNPNLSNKPL